MTEILLGLVTPFRDIVTGPAFFVEVLLGGIAAGLMYSLVALGFVLIFKASGVFNFAQGVMVLFAALTLVGLMDRGVPVAIALALTIAVMVALAFTIERVVLRPLVNQAAIILFMATIGLNFFLEGFGEMLWGSNVKRLDVGIPDTSFTVAGVLVNRLEMTAALTAGILVAVLAVFFQRTRIGRALRAVADDPSASLARRSSLRRTTAYASLVAPRRLASGSSSSPSGRDRSIEGHRSPTVIYREAGQFKTTYAADQAIFPIVQDRVFVAVLLAAAFLVPPLAANEIGRASCR